jgi:Mlc titration factor MtfA (ptsG expression regulator)/RimJ/RimL family protein N-acetyltransferase
MSSRAKQDAFRRELLAEPFSEEWKTWLSANMAHYRMLGDAERARLHDDTRVLIAEKTWEGCDGLKVTELMKLTVAAQAALLLLGLDHDYFSRVLSVVLFPTAFELPAESWEERGSFALGRAVNYGTVFLSWETVLAEAREPSIGHNLVIHEFAHQLDFLDGYTNGVPVLRSRDQTRRWQRVMHGTFQRLRRDLQMGRKTLLGSYAATNPTEFFSVASEKFFCLPAQLQESHPELFEVLAEYYQVAPLRWFEGKTGTIVPPLLVSTEKDQPGRQAQATPPPPAFESGFVDFRCPYCGNTVSFPGPEAGTLKQCPNCLESLIVPDRAGQPAERIPFPIRTDRLVLRRFQTVDAKDLAELMSKPDALRYLTWPPMTMEDAEEWIAWQRGFRFPHSNKYCYFAIEAVEACKIIGLSMFWFPHDEFDLAQFEIIIHPGWQRKGYAGEAIGGLLAYAFSGFRVRRVVAQCDARNLPARRLVLKAGLRQESECIQDRFLKGEWVNTVGFALLKQEYDAQRGSPGTAAKDSYET